MANDKCDFDDFQARRDQLQKDAIENLVHKGHTPETALAFIESHKDVSVAVVLEKVEVSIKRLETERSVLFNEFKENYRKKGKGGTLVGFSARTIFSRFLSHESAKRLWVVIRDLSELYGKTPLSKYTISDLERIREKARLKGNHEDVALINDLLSDSKIGKNDFNRVAKLETKLQKRREEKVALHSPEIKSTLGKEEFDVQAKRLDRLISGIEKRIGATTLNNLIHSLPDSISTTRRQLQVMHQKNNWVKLQVETSKKILQNIIGTAIDTDVPDDAIRSIFSYGYKGAGIENRDSKTLLKGYSQFLQANINNIPDNPDVALAFAKDRLTKHITIGGERMRMLNLDAPYATDVGNTATGSPENNPTWKEGEIPKENQHTSFKGSMLSLAEALGAIQNIKTAADYDGFVNETLIRSILGPDYLDVDINLLFKDAAALYGDKAAIRKFYTSRSGKEDMSAWVYRLLNRNPLERPMEEEADGWAGDDTKIVTFDMETDVTPDKRNKDMASRTGHINTFQVTVKEGGKTTHVIYHQNKLGALVKIENGLMNAATEVEGVSEQNIEGMLDILQSYQDKGFKVLTYNGLNYDFAVMAKLGGKRVQNKVKSVALRSIDVYSNLRIRLKGSTTDLRLKAVGALLLRDRIQSLPDFFPPEFTVGDGLEYNGKAIRTYEDAAFKQDQTDEERAQFSVYAINDTNLLLDMYEEMRSNQTSYQIAGNVVNLSEDFKQGYELGEAVQRSKVKERVSTFFGDFLKEASSPINQIEDTFTLGFNLNKVQEILEMYFQASLYAKYGKVNPDFKKKVNGILKNLELPTMEAIKLMKKNQEALLPIWKKRFDTNGYPISHNEDALSPTYVALEPELPTNYVLTEEGGEAAYLQAVDVSIQDFVADNHPKFIVDALTDLGAPVYMGGESHIHYIIRVLPHVLKEHVPGFTSYADFANGTLAHKVASELGPAIIQSILGQREGMTLVPMVPEDVTIQTKDDIATLAPSKVKWVNPLRYDTHTGAPYSTEEVEKTYQEWRLHRRMRFLLSKDVFTPEETKELDKWFSKMASPNIEEQLSPSIESHIPRVSPKSGNLSAFGILESKADRVQRATEMILGAPSILEFFIHDSITYMAGVETGFLSKDSPSWLKDVLYAPLSPGAPTGAVAPGGLVHSLAWLLTHQQITGPDDLERLLVSMEKGIELIETDKGGREGDTSADPTLQKRADMKFSGRHLILAILYYDQPSDHILSELKRLNIDIRENTDGSLLVNGVAIGDPRQKANDLVIKALEYDLKRDSKNKSKVALLEKLKSIQGTADAKELFKGALTPRVYQAGLVGIFEGLQVRRDKNETKNKDNPNWVKFSDADIVIISKMLMTYVPTSEGEVGRGYKNLIIDEALGFKSHSKHGDVGKYRELVKSIAKPRFPHMWHPDADKKAKEKKKQLKYIIDRLTDTFAKSLDNESPAHVKKVIAYKNKLTERYERIIREVGTYKEGALQELRNNKALSREEILLATDAISNNINKMLEAEFGKASDNLILAAIQQRQTTPMKMNVDQAFAQSQHEFVDAELMKILSKRVFYHEVGIDPSVMRQFVRTWYRINPTGSAESQLKTEENPGGLYSIVATNKTESEIESNVNLQYLLELAGNFMPPKFLGYESEGESRADFFKAIEEGSVEVTKHNNEHREDINTKVVRYRTLQTKYNKRESVIENPDTKGAIALNSPHYDLDFSQLPIPVLQLLTKKAQRKQRNPVKVLKQIQEIGERAAKEDNYGIIPPEFRGKSSSFRKHDLLSIQTSMVDPSQGLVGSFLDKDDYNIIEIHNRQRSFKREMFWQDQEDVTITFLGMQLHSQMQQAFRMLRKDKNAIQAQAHRLNSMAFLVGREARRLVKKCSTLDLQLADKDKKVSQKAIEELKTLLEPQDRIWMSVIRFFGVDNKRLEAWQKETLVSKQGVAFKGSNELANVSTSLSPRFNFVHESMHIGNLILQSVTFRKILTDFYKSKNPLLDPAGLDNAGFIIDYDIHVMKLSESDRLLVITKLQEVSNELSTELHEKQGIRLLSLTDDLFSYTPDMLVDNQDRLTEIKGHPFVDTMSPGPSNLLMPTKATMDILLNITANQDLINNISLATQTEKELYPHTTSYDILLAAKADKLVGRNVRNEQERAYALRLLALTSSSPSPDILNSIGKETVLDTLSYLGTDSLRRLTSKPGGSNSTSFVLSQDYTLTINNQDLGFILPVIQTIGRARTMGMDEHADKLIELIMKKNLEDSTKGGRFNLTDISQITGYPTLKMAVVLAHIGNDMTNQYKAADFIQSSLTDESARALFQEAQSIVRLMNAINNGGDNELNSYFHTAMAILQKGDLENRGMPPLDSVVDRIVALHAEKHPSKGKLQEYVAKAVNGAYLNITNSDNTLDSIMHFNVMGYSFNTRNTRELFTDPTKFSETFGEIGVQLVGYLNSLVERGAINERQRDAKLLILGQLALNNPDFLDSLAFKDASGTSSYATAAKENGRYTISFNIDVVETTPEHEAYMAFAEELMHIARLKYMTTGSPEWNKLKTIFGMERARPMIRKILLASKIRPGWGSIEKATDYAMSNLDEFFAHFGAAILLQETLYKNDVLESLAARYQEVGRLTNWWRKAFSLLFAIGDKMKDLSAHLMNDPEYSDLFIPMNDLAMSLIRMDVAGRADVGNPDASFNSLAKIEKYTGPVAFTGNLDAGALDALGRQAEQLRNLMATLPIDRSPEDVENITRLTTRLSDPTINPSTALGKVAEASGFVNTLPRKSTTKAVSVDSLSSEQRQAILNRMVVLNSRSDLAISSGNISSMVRGLVSDKKLRTADALVDSLNEAHLGHDSAYSIITALAALINGKHIVQEDSFTVTKDGLGFHERKDIHRELLNPALHAIIELKRTIPITEMEAVHENIARLILGQSATFASPQIEHLAKIAANSYKSFKTEVAVLMENTNVKGRSTDEDDVGVKLKKMALSVENKKALVTAVRTELLRKMKQEIVDKENSAPVHCSVLLLGGKMKDAESIDEFDADRAIELLDPSFMLDRNTKVEDIILYSIALQARNQFAIDRKLDPMGFNVTSLMVQDKSVLIAMLKRATGSMIYLSSDPTLPPQSFDELFSSLSGSNPDGITMIREAYMGLLGSAPVTDNTAAIKLKHIQSVIPKTNSNIFETDSYHPIDIIVNSFLINTSSTYIGRNEGKHLSYDDLFLSGDTDAANRVLFHQYFTKDIQVLGDTLRMKRGLEALEKDFVNKRLAIDNLDVDIETLIEWTRELKHIILAPAGEKASESAGQINAAADRLLSALNSSRGTLVRDLGAPFSLNRAGVAISHVARYFLSKNIPLATLVVEGSSATMAQVFQGGQNPITFVGEAIQAFMHMKKENIKGILTDEATSIHAKKLFGGRHKEVLEFMREVVWILDEAASDRSIGDPSAVGNAEDDSPGWVKRMADKSERQAADVSHALYIALEASYRRQITGMLQDGSLIKLRDTYNRIHTDPNSPKFMNAIKAAMKAEGINTSQEIVFAWLESGLFGENVLEQLTTLLHEFPTVRGYISVKSYTTKIQELQSLSTNKAKRIHIDQMQNAWLRFTQAAFEASKISVVRTNPLDSSARSHALNFVYSFWRGYAAMYVRQQALKRAATASPQAYLLGITSSLLLDMAYSVALMVSTGLWDEDKVKKVLRGEDWGEVARLALRFPLFSSSSFAYMVNLLVIPLFQLGLGSHSALGMINSIGETALASRLAKVRQIAGAINEITLGNSLTAKQKNFLLRQLSIMLPEFGGAITALAISPLTYPIRPGATLNKLSIDNPISYGGREDREFLNSWGARVPMDANQERLATQFNENEYRDLAGKEMALNNIKKGRGSMQLNTPQETEELATAMELPSTTKNPGKAPTGSPAEVDTVTGTSTAGQVLASNVTGKTVTPASLTQAATSAKKAPMGLV